MRCLPGRGFAASSRQLTLPDAPQELAKVLWHLARQRSTHPELLSQGAAAIEARIVEFSQREVTGVVWSLALLRSRDEGLLDTLAVRAVQEMQACRPLPHTLSTTAWAFARMQHSDEILFGVISKQTQSHLAQQAGDPSCLTLVSPQALSNTAWAFATLFIEDRPLMSSITSAVCTGLDSFGPQDLVNTVWSFATVQYEDEDLYQQMAAKCFAAVNELTPQGLGNVVWAFASLVQSQRPAVATLASLVLPRLAEADGHRDRAFDTVSLLSLLWAFTFSSVEVAESVVAKLSERLQQIGRELDQKQTRAARPFWPGRLYDMGDPPQVLADCGGVLAVLKPAGIEVDAGEVSWRVRSAEKEVRQAPSRRHPSLSLWLRAALEAPIASDAGHAYGVLGRLDVPSSGILLCAKTYEAFYALHVALARQAIQREYVILCHGHMEPLCERVVDIRLRRGSNSVVTIDSGRPAKTTIKPLAHLTCGTFAETAVREARFTLAAVSITTGRTHQIRAHCKAIGHPTVCDPVYTSAETFESDRRWCPRNFLHRFRVCVDPSATGAAAAIGGGSVVDVRAALPGDLRRVLERLLQQGRFRGLPPAIVKAWLRTDFEPTFAGLQAEEE